MRSDWWPRPNQSEWDYGSIDDMKRENWKNNSWYEEK